MLPEKIIIKQGEERSKLVEIEKGSRIFSLKNIHPREIAIKPFYVDERFSGLDYEEKRLIVNEEIRPILKAHDREFTGMYFQSFSHFEDISFDFEQS